MPLYGFCNNSYTEEDAFLCLDLNRRVSAVSYFGGPALVHQINVLVSSNAHQPQTWWVRKLTS